jgi:hypothetical protein
MPITFYFLSVCNVMHTVRSEERPSRATREVIQQNGEIIDGIIGERRMGIDAKKLGSPFAPKTNSGMMQMQMQMPRHFNSSCGAPGMKARRNM